MTDGLKQKAPNILIVDDTPANVLLLEKTLQARGYHTRSVLSGKLALETARMEPPDLILLDINMPEMDGFELCRQIKADPLLEEISVIFMSVRSDTADKVKAFGLGGVDYVTKPFQLEEFYTRIETHLKIRSLQRRLSRQNDKQERLLAEIQDAREYAENIVETVRMPLVVLNSELRILTANQSFYDTFKVIPDDTTGKFVYDLGNRQWDIPALRTLIEKILPQNSVFNDYEVEHDFPHIGHKLFLLNARQIFRRTISSHIILLALEDITDRVAAEKKLVRAHNEWRETFNTIPDLVAILDTDHRIVRVNRAMAAALKVDADDARGLTCYRHVHGADSAPANCPHSLALADGREHVSEIHEERLGGWFQVSATPIHDEEGELLGSVHVVHDITKIKQNEQKLQEQAALLQQEIAQRRSAQELLQRQQLLLETLNGELEERVAAGVGKCREKDLMVMRQEKLASLGQLAAGVAHEINNPISFISSNLREFSDYFAQMSAYVKLQQGLLAETATGEQQEQLAEATHRLEIPMILDDGGSLIAESLDGVARVERIINDLKSFVRLDTTEYEKADLTTCLEGALTIVSNELKYVAVVTKEYQPLPPILCHPGQLNQVFLNLLINAGHAVADRPEGRITLRSRHDDGFVYASVTDNGHGIPDELKERIFEAFFTTKEVGKGTGLGLSISSDIVNKHHGELRMESVVGGGTTFTVMLPRTSVESA
jgi:PAS domain S-box-containing protein